MLLAYVTVPRLAAAMGPLRSVAWDVRSHLSTKSPYAWRVPHPGAPSLYQLPDPPGHSLVFLHVLARHGTRWPTADRTAQMLSLAPLLQVGRTGV